MAENDSKSGEGSGVATPDALEQVEALKARVAASAVATEEANRNARAAAELANAAVSEVQGLRAASEATTRTSDLDRANGEMAALKGEYKEAFTAGDADAMADAQAKMARLGGKIERLEIERDARPARQAGDTGRVAARDTGAGTPDQFEQFLATRTPQTAAWLRQNRQHWQDPVANGKIVVADRMWDRTGKPKDSPEYFSFIEKEAGLASEPARAAAADGGRATNGSAADAGGDDPGKSGTAADLTPAGANAALPSGRRGPPQAGRGRGAPLAAPPTRDGAPNLSGRGDSGTKRITPEMQQWAKMMYPPTKDNPDGGIDPELYYDEYKRLVEEGEINERFGR